MPMPHRVVVIDDDAEFRELLRTLFAEFGTEVVALAAPPPDVGAIARMEPDAVILDLAFEPDDLSGWQLLQRLRDEPLTRELPVVVCTAAAGEVAGQEAWLAERGVGTLIKPFSLEQLEAALDSVTQPPGDGR